MTDFYNLLGVPPEADPDTIRRAYRTRAKAVHPDAHPHLTPEERARQQRAFIQLAQAYDTLSDPVRRRAYDRQRPVQARSPAAGAGTRRAPASGARPAGAHRSRPRPRRQGAGEAPPETPDLEDLLQDVDRLLARFGLDRRLPAERLLDELLDWARALFREVMASLNAEPAAAPGAERPVGADSGSGTARTEPGRAGKPHPAPKSAETVDAELARMKAQAQRGRASGRGAGGGSIEQELARLKRRLGKG